MAVYCRFYELLMGLFARKQDDRGDPGDADVEPPARGTGEERGNVAGVSWQPVVWICSAAAKIGDLQQYVPIYLGTLLRCTHYVQVCTRTHFCNKFSSIHPWDKSRSRSYQV